MNLNLTYYIFPGTYKKNDFYLIIHNQLFSFWYYNWSKVFGSLANPIEIKSSDFRRQTYIGALIDTSNEIIGITLHTVFNLNALADCNHHYFTTNYSDQFLTELKKRQLTQVMSIEYLTVAENYRKRESGFSAAKYLVALSHRLQRYVGVEASISTCRKDVQVDKLEMQFGGQPLNPPGIIYGVETQNLVTYTNNLLEPHALTANIDSIWNKRFFVELNDSEPRLETTLKDIVI